MKKSIVFWIAIGAVLLVLVLGFTQAGWLTAGSATKLADTAAQSAVVERLASICVAQSGADLQQASKLEEFKAISSSSRQSTYVKDQGWATMPGETTPDSRVATACAKQLMLVGE